MKKNLFLFLILLLSAVLRLYRLNDLPISLFGDEIDVGYHAWSLWTTGRDYLGHFLPTYIYSLSESRAPLLMYVAAPFVGLLGPSAFSVRLPIALLGVLNVYLLYLLTNKLFDKFDFKNLKIFSGWHLNIGHLAAFFLAISPWHIHYSRAAFEVTLLLSLLLAGVYLFLKWFDSPQRFPLWPLPFVLTFYTYSTANLFTPLLVLSLLLVYRPKLKYLLTSFIYVVLLLPIGYQLLVGPAAGRFNLVSIFNDKLLLDDIIVQRTEPWVVPGIDETIFHNKPLSFLTAFGRQYLQVFSLDFLFLDGDPNFRHSVSRFGELPWFLALFFFIGLANTLFHPNKTSLFVLSWLLLGPVPSALTQGGGTHATRLFIMLPPLIIFSVLGAVSFLDLLKNRKIQNTSAVLFAALSLYYIVGYWHHYADHYRFQSAKYWHYGYHQVFDQMKTLNPQKRVFINNTYEPALLRFAFFNQIHPQDFQKMFTTDVPQDNLFPNFSGFKFGDRFYFGQVNNAVAIQQLLEPGDYYLAVKYKEIPENWAWLETPPEGFVIHEPIKDVLGNPVFYWITAQ